MSYNKFTGDCFYCGHTVASRSGELIGKRNGRWAIAHLNCNKNNSAQVTKTYFPSTGETVYQNSRGRCEDAPCCGCCS